VSGDEKKEPKPADPGKLTTQPVVEDPGTKYELRSDLGSRVRASKNKEDK
jgi:hypothetical protein